ncbi:hypothetical protein LDENG_00055770 [Lucifuga dentata]|nr:hypothetical protein LDENG_00055770 [Lucifuga dentata]
MPVQQISVVPVRETASNGKSAPQSKDKNESKKAPGRSGSRSSNISKASNSTTGLGAVSRTSITPSSQDICRSVQPAHLSYDASELHKHSKHTHTAEMTVNSATLGSSAQLQMKQVKHWHRRKKKSCTTVKCLDTNTKNEPTDCSDRSLSSDRGELGEKREQSSKKHRELPPRLRCLAFAESDSTSGDDAWREAHSWSKEKARRALRCTGSSREREEVNDVKGGKGKTDSLELQSVRSDEGKENQVQLQDSGGLKKRPSCTGSINGEGRISSRETNSQDRDKEKSYNLHSPEGSSSLAEDGEEHGEDLITKRYQEKGSGSRDMAVPTPGNHCGVKAGTEQLCSFDSELEVCRICHCEGDEEYPLIMPCRCTGTLSFVHQACLNQWIKSSDTRCCELCKFDFIMETKLKPLSKWERLHMTKSERRKIYCSVLFHLIAIVCMLWSIYILVKRTAEEIRLGKNEELRRISLLKYYNNDGILEWPFWTKLIVVAIGFTGGLIFMYIQCKVYLQLWRRLKAFNRIITVQNCPEKGSCSSQVRLNTLTNGKHETVEIPVSSTPVTAPEVQTDSDQSVEAAVAPAQNPV